MSPITVVAGLGLALALGLTLVAWVMERVRLRRLRRARDAAQLRRAAAALPGAVRLGAEGLADAVDGGGPIEPALLDALRTLGSAPFRPPAALAGLREVTLVGLGVAPLTEAVLRAPAEVAAAEASLLRGPIGLALVDGVERLAGPFEVLARAYLEGGATLGLLAVVWALDGWLRAPEVREARALAALFEAGGRLAPDAAASVAGRMLEALAPTRGLRRPIVASLVWVGLITLAWGALLITAPHRETNQQPPALSIWPSGQTRPVEIPPGLHLPRARGGRPLRQPRTLLAIGPREARVGTAFLVDWQGESLPEGWARAAESRATAAGGLPVVDRVSVAVDAAVPSRIALDVLRFLGERSSIGRFDLLLERPDGTLQAHMPARLGAIPDGAIEVEVEPRGTIRIDRAPGTPRALRGRLRRHWAREGRPPVVAVRPHPHAQWGAVIAALGIADDTCPGPEDCPQPGIGFELVLPQR